MVPVPLVMPVPIVMPWVLSGIAPTLVVGGAAVVVVLAIVAAGLVTEARRTRTRLASTPRSADAPAARRVVVARYAA